jgi:hypothetical protein
MSLMTSTRVRLRDLGVNPLQGSAALDSRMETVYGIYPWVGGLVMGNFMGRRFWVGCRCFFWEGRVGEEKESGHVRRVGFRWTTHVVKQTNFFLLYIIY